MGTTQGTEHRIVGLALAAGAAIAFGTLAISAKFAYRAGSSVLPLLTARFVGATLLLGLFHMVTLRTIKVPSGVMWKLLVLGGIGYGTETAFFFGALERAPAGVVSLIFYSFPLWVMLLGFATRMEPFRWRLVVALLVGSVGVGIVFSPESGSLAGPLLALGAAVSVAIYFLLMQIVLRDVDASPAAFWTSAGAAVTTTVAALVARDPLPSGAVVPALALAVASGVAFIAFYAAIVRIGSARTAIAAMIEPIATLILAVVLLDEIVTTRLLLGAAFVLVALGLLALAGEEKLEQSP